MVCQRIMLSWPLIIDINVKNIKNDKILWENAAPQKVDTERWKTDGKWLPLQADRVVCPVERA